MNLFFYYLIIYLPSFFFFFFHMAHATCRLERSNVHWTKGVKYLLVYCHGLDTKFSTLYITWNISDDYRYNILSLCPYITDKQHQVERMGSHLGRWQHQSSTVHAAVPSSAWLRWRATRSHKQRTPHTWHHRTQAEASLEAEETPWPCMCDFRGFLRELVYWQHSLSFNMICLHMLSLLHSSQTTSSSLLN